MKADHPSCEVNPDDEIIDKWSSSKKNLEIWYQQRMLGLNHYQAGVKFDFENYTLENSL